jgi:hypothetical protein
VTLPRNSNIQEMRQRGRDSGNRSAESTSHRIMLTTGLSLRAGLQFKAIPDQPRFYRLIKSLVSLLIFLPVVASGSARSLYAETDIQ